jgi:hypothetical protein
MSLIVEDGTGLYNANSYVGRGAANVYLATANKIGEWSAASDDEQEAALIIATSYLDLRFGSSFIGYKRTDGILIPAKGNLFFSSLPLDGDTVTIDETVYTFVTSATNPNEVTIAATVLDAVVALAAAMAGTGGGAGTVAHSTAVSEALRTAPVLMVAAAAPGALAAPIATLSNNTRLIWDNDCLLGDSDYGVQSLQFPRKYLYFDNLEIIGVPADIKNATIEYANRSLTQELMPDPENEDSGGQVKSTIDKIGPIEISREYNGAQSKQIFVKFPYADRMISRYINAGSGVIK